MAWSLSRASVERADDVWLPSDLAAGLGTVLDAWGDGEDALSCFVQDACMEGSLETRGVAVSMLVPKLNAVVICHVPVSGGLLRSQVAVLPTPIPLDAVHAWIQDEPRRAVLFGGGVPQKRVSVHLWHAGQWEVRHAHDVIETSYPLVCVRTLPRGLLVGVVGHHVVLWTLGSGTLLGAWSVGGVVESCFRLLDGRLAIRRMGQTDVCTLDMAVDTWATPWPP